MSMKKVLRTLILTCFAVAVSFAAMAQQEVKGVVTDESGEPLPGVTVVVAGTSSGVITDIKLNLDDTLLLVDTVDQLRFVDVTVCLAKQSKRDGIQ